MASELGEAGGEAVRELAVAQGRSHAASSYRYRIVKRGLDLLGALAGLALGLPLMTVIAVLIRLDSAGPSLYRQWRLGQGGERFRLLKFRSMRADSEGLLSEALEGDPGLRLTWKAWQKLQADPRLTKLGRFLRRTSLDELPQLLNVLRGEMSLVGPRPILPTQREIYGDAFPGYVQMRPGLTGLWQVSGRNQLSFAERAALDAAYLETWSLSLDLSILVRTVRAVVSGYGAF